MSLLIQAVVLAKAQRRKGRKGKILAMVGLNSQRPSTHGSASLSTRRVATIEREQLKLGSRLSSRERALKRRYATRASFYWLSAR